MRVILNIIKNKKMIYFYKIKIIIKRMHRNYKSGRFTNKNIKNAIVIATTEDKTEDNTKKNDKNKTKSSNKYNYKFYELF